MQQELANASAVLARVRALFDASVLALAQRCQEGGRLNAKRLDEQQVASFEMAWAGAELLAAETAIAALTPASVPLDARLALVFTVDAVVALLDRLDVMLADTGQDPAAVDALRTLPAWRALRQAAGGSEALRAAGRGVIDAQGIVGEVALDEQHAMAQDAFRRFAQEVVAPQAEAIHRHDLTVPESLLQPMREMGVFGLAIPEEHGGSAPNDHDDTLLMVVVTEALSEGSLAAAGSLITRPEILTRALLAGGTDEQKHHWLPRLASGDSLCAIAMTEPDYGSDLAACVLKGTRVPGGWVLNGAKTWCTFAGKASVLMVVTRTDPDRSLGHKGLSVLLAEKPSFDTHEFEVVQDGGGKLSGRAIPTIGYRGMHSFDLAFQDYFVPDANVVGGEAGLGKGFYYTLAGMVGGRMQTSARACGVMRAALRAAVRYTQDRKVFGAPLADLALTQAKIARMAARHAACRRLAYTVAGIVDSGNGRMEASLVKLLACRSAEIITREALQLHGGMGYAEETPVSRYFVDARVLSIFEGAEETLALKVIARSLMERAMGVQQAGE
ncbi:acyl-CoA dehydrogenase family protein [Hydrogenophaga sp.]|uniref:acyl-CoA dehydrogenase family protein n=1 Tax=Hydrogenophaga sp. TaxID=1904254 RepID=UPI003F70B666